MLPPTSENIIRKPEILFEALFVRSRDALLIIDSNCMIVDANRMAARLLRTDRRVLAGSSCDVFFNVSGLPGLLEASELIDSWTPPVARMLKNFPDTGFDMRVIKLRPQDDKSLYALQLDALSTERAAFLQLREDVLNANSQAEKERMLRRQLQVANEKLSAFAYRAAHDLRGPLRRIRVALDFHRKYSNSEGSSLEALSLAQDSTIELELLVENLLEYSKRTSQALVRQQINLTDVLHPAIRLVDQQDLPPDWIGIDPMPVVNADPGLLTIVFRNLISNAVKYRAPDRLLNVHIRAETLGDCLQVSVTDNGRGFSEDSAVRIFKLFERAHSGVDGAGIGLATCDELVQNHGWTIEAEGRVNEGASFLISIPWKDVVSLGAERPRASG